MSRLLTFASMGFTLTLRVDDPQLYDLARDFHSAARTGITDCVEGTPADLAWRHATAGDWQIDLRGNPWGEPLPTPEHLFLHSDGLLDDLVRELCGDAPLLHAAAVVDPSGRGVIICGPSGSGKTSLTLACILQGWNWLSDEWLGFRSADARRAEGFCRNFNLKERSFELFGQIDWAKAGCEFTLPTSGRCIRFLNPKSLNGGAHLPAADIRRIVFPQFDPDAGPPVIRPVAGVELIQALAPELRTSKSRMFEWLGEFSRHIHACTLRYRNPHEVPAVLGELPDTP